MAHTTPYYYYYITTRELPMDMMQNYLCRKQQNLIKKGRIIEILMSICYTTTPRRHKQLRQA